MKEDRASVFHAGQITGADTINLTYSLMEKGSGQGDTDDALLNSNMFSWQGNQSSRLSHCSEEVNTVTFRLWVNLRYSVLTQISVFVSFFSWTSQTSELLV